MRNHGDIVLILDRCCQCNRPRFLTTLFSKKTVGPFPVNCLITVRGEVNICRTELHQHVDGGINLFDTMSFQRRQKFEREQGPRRVSDLICYTHLKIS